MAIRKYKPTSAGRRHASVADFSDLTAKRPERGLVESLKSSGGRNSAGRMTVRRRGGGHKRQYRRIDFRRDKDGVPARVKALEYDPNRSARIALLFYADGEKRYILAPNGLKVGDEVVSGDKVAPNTGNAMPLEGIPEGFEIHNIELQPGRGGRLARSAGMTAVLANKEGKYGIVVLPSGERRKILLTCRATIGQVGNMQHQNVVLGKAGRSRWKGRRPKVRGTAMNPVAHPMGGGEGRNSGGRKTPCSPTGKPSKGGRTRKKKKLSNKHIIRGRKRGKHQTGK